jgi:hypothetical protein
MAQGARNVAIKTNLGGNYGDRIRLTLRADHGNLKKQINQGEQNITSSEKSKLNWL